MSGISTCVVAGNITRDPELNDRGTVLSFSVAVNRYEKDRDGTAGEAVHFFDVRVLGARAKGLATFLVKGQGVTVQGDLVQEKWEKDGQKRTAVRILAREVVTHGKADGASKSSPVVQRESAPDLF